MAFEMNFNNPIYPTDAESREDILSIDRQAKVDARLKHHLYYERDWEMNTITHIVLETMIQALYGEIIHNGIHMLSDDSDNTFDFYDLLEIAASYINDDSAEKTGNINIKFIPGPRVRDIVNDATPLEKVSRDFVKAEAAYLYPDNDTMTKAMLSVDRTARHALKDKYGSILPNDWYAIATAYVFLEDLFRHLAAKLNASEKKQVMINYNELIEIHAQKNKKTGEIEVFLRPGMEAKLLIKSDATTEVDD